MVMIVVIMILIHNQNMRKWKENRLMAFLKFPCRREKFETICPLAECTVIRFNCIPLGNLLKKGYFVAS